MNSDVVSPEPAVGSPAGLSRLFNAVFDDGDEWTSDDLAGMWCDLLETRLSDVAASISAPPASGTHAELTIGAVLYGEGIGASAVGFVKMFAETAGYQRRALPERVAGALYYLALAAALTRDGTRLSSLAPDQMLGGLRWAASQNWIDRRGAALASIAAEGIHGGNE